MKKIVITDEVMTILANEKSFLHRSDIEVIRAHSNDEVLQIHRTKRADVVIATLDESGMKIEELCSTIRSDKVSIIIICKNNAADLERSAQCKANVVVTRPVNTTQLLEKAQQLLDISMRESQRVLVAVFIEGAKLVVPFFGRSVNISLSGILIETENILEKGDQVSCSFFLPNAGKVATNGEIVRIDKQGAGSKAIQYGIRFLSLKDKEKPIIESFINRQS